MRVDLPLDKKTGKSGPGHRAVAAVGRGPMGLRAAGPSRAVDRRPLGREPAFSKTRNFVVSSGSLLLKPYRGPIGQNVLTNFVAS